MNQVADADLLAGLADGFPLAQQNVGCPELVNDLFGVIPFLRHGSDLLTWLFTTFDLDQLFQASFIGKVISPITNDSLPEKPAPLI
jgi:hypothetical protein